MAICDNHKYKSNIAVPEAKVTHKRGEWSDDVKKRLKDGEVFFDTSEKTGIWLGEQDLETGKIRVAHIAAAASEVEDLKEYVDDHVIKIGKRIDTLEKYVDTVDEKTDLLQTNVTHLSEDVDHLRDDVDELRDRKVTHEMIADGAVYEENIKDQGIPGTKLYNYTITNDQMAEGSIRTANIVDRAVTSDKLAQDSVTNPKIANGAVTGDKIADLTITSNNLAPSSVTFGKLGTAAVGVDNLEDGVVRTAKIFDGAVTTEKIADGAITTLKLDDNLKFRDTYRNTFEDSISYSSAINADGKMCDSSHFGARCMNNLFGDNVYQNFFGAGCVGNKFSDNVQNNYFGNSFTRNTLKYPQMHGNVFGNNCGENIFEEDFRNNTLGNNVWYNEFGSVCWNNTIGNQVRWCKFGFLDSCVIGSGVENVIIKHNGTVGNRLRNVHILSGVRGAQDNRLTITFDDKYLNQDRTLIVTTKRTPTQASPLTQDDIVMYYADEHPTGSGISTDYSDKQTTDVDPSSVDPNGLYKFADGNVYIVDDKDGVKTWRALGGDEGGTWNPVA